jgi:Tfp pilus assembly protein PilW
MRLLSDENGFTMVELLFVSIITVVLMGGLSTVLSIGLTTSSTSNALIASQSGVVVVLDRLDYEGRCASNASLISGGAGVTLTFPSQCTHATGTVTWCVSSGSLVRYAGSSCSGTGLTLATNVASATPFSCVKPVGSYPGLQVALTMNSGSTSSTASSGTDVITLENAPLTTSTSAACA